MERAQFEEELRQLGAIDQKAGALLGADALLFAGSAMINVSSSTALGYALVCTNVVLQLLLLLSATLALVGVKMMSKFRIWPLRDEPVSDDEYKVSVMRIAGIVRDRRHCLDLSWLGTLAATLLLTALVATKGAADLGLIQSN